MHTTSAERSRIVALDVARGIAILGTLATNIWIFAGVSSASLDALFSSGGFTLAGEVAAGTPGAVVDTVLHLVTDGKFLGLLTIMFGIGMEIQRQSALRHGKRWPGGYYWRAALLAIEGLLNYIFVFEFDVLMAYGLTALAIAPVVARSERVQKVLMWVALVVHVAVIALLDTFLALAFHLATEEELAEMADSLQFYESTDSYAAMVRTRLTDFVDGRMEMPVLITMGLAMFLVGARLYRAGLFHAERARLRRKVLVVGLVVGLPLDWGLRLFATSSVAMTTRYVTSAVVAFGILALIAEYYVRRGNRLGGVGRALSAVGRMALTCYILQNLLASVLFYDFGFGLARRIDGTVGVFVVYLLICAVMIAFSRVWLRRFARGPVESVMHRLHS
ncbi:DUF418 domain-containing protein [Corynebacterium sp. LK2510]|uniref:DUF418 domain-containing protein n=1 Tax=Corynebacterium sp. LK2510 TaxID=3110472 RepID=UPI0034CE0E14